MLNINEYIELIDKKLDEYIKIQYPENIFKSMKYTVTLPGKRLRPIMCLETCKMFGGNIEDAIPTACAIEMLHAQTLIHDDLPCMDNDNFRRGKPTNHKVFGDAIATLAGDALLTFAPQIITKYSTNLSAETTLRVLNEFFEYAGAYGVIAGQVVDIENEGKMQERSKEENSNILEYLHIHKTSDLFKLSMKTGAIIAGANEAQIKDIENFATKFGFAFQISDDILDETATFEELGKTIGKDKASGKLTYVTLNGLNSAKCKVGCLTDECHDIITRHRLKSDIFNQIIDSIRKRAGV
ncbi:MAG: polyprenyl synthetase family protein [Clostridiaceae bacterium]|jgi:geranylgeranyl diphosphate synthase, type II|nr:polyprenyl synthetase family protein [Clostridiaceae bacterium]